MDGVKCCTAAGPMWSRREGVKHVNSITQLPVNQSPANTDFSQIPPCCILPVHLLLIPRWYCPCLPYRLQWDNMSITHRCSHANDSAGHTTDRRPAWNKCRLNHCLDYICLFHTQLSYTRDRAVSTDKEFNIKPLKV